MGGYGTTKDGTPVLAAFFGARQNPKMREKLISWADDIQGKPASPASTEKPASVNSSMNNDEDKNNRRRQGLGLSSSISSSLRGQTSDSNTGTRKSKLLG